MPIKFFLIENRVTLKDRNKLKLFLLKLFKKEKKKILSLNYIFCSDEYLLNINQQYLQHNYYTDIITFDLSEAKDKIEGEVYISIDRVKENALENKVAFKEELYRVIFHGALHLCGYKDKSINEIKKMRSAENKYLKHYFS
jgi:probable rRNA maturation factor